MEIKLKDLLEAGCHFGHQVTRWNPKMKPYIFTARDKVHIFDLVKTKKGLEEAAVFAKALVTKGGKIIFVGTKRQAKGIIKEAAQKVGMPYVSERWVGGTLTNWDYIERNLNNLREMKSKREAGEYKDFTKKERLLIDRKVLRTERIFGGISQLEKLPEALFIVDIKNEIGAAREAKMRGIPVISIIDTNSNPDLADFVIPANDDAVKSIQLVVDYLTQAIEEGKKETKGVETKVKEKTEDKPAFAKASEDKEEKVKKEKPKTTKSKKVSKKKTAAGKVGKQKEKK